MKKCKKIKVFYHNDNPEIDFINGYGNSVAVDLYTAEDITLGAGQSAIIDLGVSIDLPKGYKADLKPRSSTFKKYGIIQTNGTGLIDSTYVGLEDKYGMPVHRVMTDRDLQDYMIHTVLAQMTSEVSTFDTPEQFQEYIESIYRVQINPITIPKGTRLCQIEIVKAMDEVKFDHIDNPKYWEAENRGGFGSTDSEVTE